MPQSFRRRSLIRPRDFVATDEISLQNKGVSKRSILCRFISQRDKSRLLLLMSTCLVMAMLFPALGQKTFRTICRLVTWYFEVHCESEDVALWRGTHLEQKFPKLDTKETIDLVVSHCDLPIDWIFDWAAPLEFRDIRIFSKCGKPVVGAPERAKIVKLENVGRCDHTYAHFLANYRSESTDLGSERSDFVLFLKDNDNSHRSHYGRHKKLDEMVPLAKEFGFACHEESNWIWSKSSTFNPIIQISYYHDWAGLRQYSVEEYSRLRRDENLNFKSHAGDTLGDYAEQMGIQPHKFSKSNDAPAVDLGVFGNQDVIVPVCYGGNFIVRSEQILHRESEFWARIESSLSRSNNIAEGHFVERLWGTMLAKPLQLDLARRILTQARQEVCRVDKNHLGALCR